MKMLMRIKIFIVFLLILNIACNEKQIKNSSNNVSNKNYTNDSASISGISSNELWNEFYNHFHKDSLFQLSRIKFPLDGYGYYGDEDLVKWSKTKWKMLKHTVYEIDTTQYKTKIINSDTLVTVKVYVEDSGVDIEQRYKRINGKWYLVYYLDAFN